jgi:hypothetical protein
MTIDLASLSLDERRELHAQLAYEFRGSKSGAAELPNELWDAICEAIKTTGRSRQPLGRFLESFGKSEYQRCSEQMDALIARAVPKGTRKPVVMAVRRVMIDTLIAHLDNRNIPVSPRSILNSFGMLKYAVDQAYPGYIEAQLLHMVAMAIAA